ALDQLSTDPEVAARVLELLSDVGGGSTAPASSADSPALTAGSVIGRYRVDRELGRGGMGEVYAGTDTVLGRPVAIKILPAHLAAGRIERSMKEAKVTSALNHPNIVTVFEFIQEPGALAIVMELVEGRTLRSYLSKRMEFADFFRYGRQ